MFSSRKRCLLLILGAFLLSRSVYYWRGLRFETGTLVNFWQIIDPALLRERPWQSLIYSRSQMPGFNAYLALVMHAFPQHPVVAYQVTFLCLGLILAVCLFVLLDRLRVNRRISVLIVVLSVMSPATILFENWLFYEYPIAVLFCISALFLNRYAKNGSRTDGALFFTSLACLGLLRVIYHWLWFLAIVVITVYALPKRRLRTVTCAIVPGVLLLAVYIKCLMLFGLFMPGSDTFSSINLAGFASRGVPKQTLSRMVTAGAVSPVLGFVRDLRWEDPALMDLVKVQPRMGIPILDNRLKSTGRINMDSLFMAAVGRQIRRDAMVLLRAHPFATIITITRNVQWYFLPADFDWPWDWTEHPNQKVMWRYRTYFNLLTTGNYPSNKYAFISYITIPLVLWFGLRRSIRWLKRAVRGRGSSPTELTAAFAFVNILYLSGLIIFYDFAEQNRILFEVFPLFAVLLGLLIRFFGVRKRIRNIHVAPT
jgi:hypothetical protein